MHIKELLKERILVLDGAMGTMLQDYKLDEEGYRGERFKDHSHSQKGNNDLLTLSRPDIIREVHRAYFEAGADIVETNTFCSTSIAQADYGMEDLVYELNYEAAKIARAAAEDFTERQPDKPRFVAGSIGPTNQTASISPDVNLPGFRATSFDKLKDAYAEEVSGLMDGGADLLLVETIFDTLNGKAALMAIQEKFVEKGYELPVMVSGTITDKSGRTLSGQTTEAFLISMMHMPLLSIGLNCALGAKELLPYLQVLDQKSPFYVSVHPNAGLPNEFGEYDETPEMMAAQIREFLELGLVNIVGGCCGTTPAHIRALADMVKEYKPRRIPEREAVFA